MPRSSTSSSELGAELSDAARARRFALRVALFLSPLVLAALALHAVLYASSEAWSMDRVLSHEARARERGQTTLFQRAFVAEEMRRYKLENALRRQPALLALGSSTAMELRGRAFGPHGSEFYNVGGLLQHPGQLTQIQQLVEALPELRLIVLAVDPWWFNDGWQPRNKFLSIEFMRETAAYTQDLRARLRAFSNLAERLFEPAGIPTIRALFTRWNRSEPEGLPGAFGIGLGSRTGSGFRGTDGSYRYAKYLARRAAGGPYIDTYHVVQRIEKGQRRLEPGRFRVARMAPLESFLRWCDARGVVVAGFAVPFASDARVALARSPAHPGLLADYQREVPALFERTGMPYVDAVDAFGRDDRSMVDGMHGSEVVMAEVVLRLLAHPKMRSALPELDPAELEALLADPRTTFAELAPELP
jgi:hypothetical protein